MELSSVLLILFVIVPSSMSQQWWGGVGQSVSRGTGLSNYGSSIVQPGGASTNRLTRHLSSSGGRQQQELMSTSSKPRQVLSLSTKDSVDIQLSTRDPNSLQPGSTRFSMRPTPASGHPLKLGPQRRGRIEPLFSAAEEGNVIGESESEVKSEGWVLPPSLMAVPAVPGAPVRNIQSAPEEQITPLQKPAKVPEKKEEDPYLQFMPVPAVPDPATDLQASRQPKDSLNTVDLNLNLPNRVDLEPSITRRPQVNSLGPSNNPQKPEFSFSSEDDKKEARRKFKRCHGRCVQKQCLPVGNLNDYHKCVDNCKQNCNQ